MKTRSPFAPLLLSAFLTLLLLPVLVLLIWSVARSWPWPSLLPAAYSAAEWKSLFSASSRLAPVLLQSVLLAGGVTLLSLAASVPAAKALGLLSFPGKSVVEMLVLAPVIVPPLSYAPGMHLLFLRLGIADSFAGVLLAHLVPCLPYGIRILTNVFRALGDRLEMQARVLGASPFQAFLHVTLPLIAPGMASAGGLLFIVSLSQYLLTFFLGGGRIVTLSMVLLPLVKDGERAAAAVWSTLFIAVSLLFCLLMERAAKRCASSRDTFFLS